MRYNEKIQRVKDLVNSKKAMKLLKKIVSYKNRRFRHKAFIWAITNNMPRTALFVANV